MEKTFDAKAREAEINEAWEAEGCFKAGAGAEPGAETFSIMIPPPNVTGSLHMGHAFNNTLQDILVRWHRMRGHDTLWQPGTDHAGIATQMVTEREMAANGEPTRREMGREKFLERVWEQKAKSRGTIIGQLKRLGASCDWSREAFTMGGAPGDPDAREGGQNFHDAVIRVFVDLYGKGIITRGKRLVNWDPHFETAISDLEVENIEQPGHMWHFKYPLAGGATYTYTERDEDGQVLFEETRDYISIATTRPETMLGDGAVAVNGDDQRYASLIGQLCEIPVGPKEHRRLIPIIADPYPDPDFGSGAVKITGAHDFNDYAVAKRGGIPMYRLMDTRAHMRADGAPYAEAAAIALAAARGERVLSEAEADTVNLVPDDLRGLDRFEARERVVAQITSEGLAVMVPPTDPRLGAKAQAPAAPEEGGETRTDQLVPLVEQKPIMQPFGDRSKVVIEPMLTDQWFVDAKAIVGPAIDEVRKGMARPEGCTAGTKILPERDAKVYFHWLENIEPWCISRQLWWGHRVPVWYGPKIVDRDENQFDAAGQTWTQPAHQALDEKDPVAFCAATFEDAAEKARAYYGDFASIGFTERESLVPLRYADHAGWFETIPLVRDPDVLDTWFSSGLWPLGTLGWPEETEELKKYFPSSVLVTGFDIIFFWVARMMMMQHAVLQDTVPDAEERKPFHTVYVHALVRDEKGRKMSKSLGNVIDPLVLIDQYGADAVRFTLAAMAAMGRDLKLSEARVAGYRNFGTKLWNAFRFAEMNGALGSDCPPTKLLQSSHEVHTVNRWIVAECVSVGHDVHKALSEYRFNDAANALYAFVWGRVCDWYVEFAKPLLADEATAAETRETMGWVLGRCLVLLHPFMPFVTEDLWSQSGREGRLVLARWPESEDFSDAEAEAEISWVINLIEAIRSVRGEVNVPAGAKVDLLRLDLDDAGRAAYERNAELIHRMARIESVSDAGSLPKGAAAIPVPGGTFALPLAGLVDVEAETARLEKAIAKIDKEIKGLSGRVNNPKFRESAPEEVVAETQANLEAREDERARLQAARARLAELA